ncbi:MAG: hypothetical protein EON87_09855 [Brevundimonas sp.]|nr:MAG: hypothetical protein EON87_09855 [Brevundimonas sp.]
MNRTIRLTLAAAQVAALGLGLVSPAGAQTAPPTTLSDVEASGFRAPNGQTYLVERAEISPDGTTIAYVAARANYRKIRVEALDGSLSRTADLEDTDLRDLMWAGNGHLLLTVMTQSIETLDVENGLMSVIAYNPAADSYETLLRDRTSINTMGNITPSRMRTTPRVMAIVFERPSVRVRDGQLEAVVDTISFDGSCRYDLYSVNLDTAAPVREVKGVQRTEAMILDETGEPAALQQEGRIKLRLGAGWRLVPPSRFGGEKVELLGLGRTGTVLVRIGDDPGARLVEVARDGGQIVANITPEGLTEVLPIHDEQTGVLLGLVGRDSDGRHAHVFFNEALAASWPSVAAAFPGDDVQLASWTSDFRKLVVYAERADGADFHLVDLDREDSRLLAPSWPQPGVAFDRTGTGAAIDIRRAAAARIQDPRRLCTDVRNAD